MKTNTKSNRPALKTSAGAPAVRTSYVNDLRRAVMANLLFEDSFYENGVEISERIKDLVKKCSAEEVAEIAVEARTKMNLRHVPLFLVVEMAKNKNQRHLVAQTLESVIQRCDELAESLSLYWKGQKDAPIANGFKKGLAAAFPKFNEYQLQKYNRDGDIKLRDVLFLCHAKPTDNKQAKVWKRLINDELKPANTWEQQLSAGKDKKKVFTQLIKDEELGGLALLRNLRGMTEAGVEEKVIQGALDAMSTQRILPFRFIAAARHAPQFEPQLEQAMFKCLEGADKLGGKTVVLIDISPSMDAALSSKSDLTRKDASYGLAMLTRELCENVEIWSFAQQSKQVPARRGFALPDVIKNAVPSSGTLLGAAVKSVSGRYDRLIVITDEESQDTVPSPDKGKLAYMINVATSKNAVGYGDWTRINGFSESCVRYITELEKSGIED